ncbi:unnamed protein product, partial [Rotaria sp. Silwood1]
HKTYFTLDEALKVIKEKVNSEISLPKIQPKRFTVHASVDPSNPYNEVIDYENMDALNKTIDESKSKTDDNKTKSSRDKSQQSRNRLNKRPALVVQQLPPPMLLPPYIFYYLHFNQIIL